jgi:hypothetical protein
MRVNKFKVQTSTVKVIFWENEGILLVEFLKRGTTIKSKQYVKTLKKLKQQIQRVWPNRKINQVLILPSIPNDQFPSSIFFAT